MQQSGKGAESGGRWPACTEHIMRVRVRVRVRARRVRGLEQGNKDAETASDSGKLAQFRTKEKCSGSPGMIGHHVVHLAPSRRFDFNDRSRPATVHPENRYTYHFPAIVDGSSPVSTAAAVSSDHCDQRFPRIACGFSEHTALHLSVN